MKRTNPRPPKTEHEDSSEPTAKLSAVPEAPGDVSGFSQVALGQRLRDARRDAHLTLQQLSQSSGYSVTHLSQVERGHACPTIGALRRISDAIGRDIRGFLEISPLPETSLVRRDERMKHFHEGGLVHSEPATHRVPGGEMAASILVVKPFGTQEMAQKSTGDRSRFFYILKGRVEMILNGQPRWCEADDAVRVAAGTEMSFRNVDREACEMLTLTLGGEV